MCQLQGSKLPNVLCEPISQQVVTPSSSNKVQNKPYTLKLSRITDLFSFAGYIDHEGAFRLLVVVSAADSFDFLGFSL